MLSSKAKGLIVIDARYKHEDRSLTLREKHRQRSVKNRTLTKKIPGPQQLTLYSVHGRVKGNGKAIPLQAWTGPDGS
jgi:hypothetical protein